MASEQDDRQREDLSDEASPYRLEEYRRKGRVAQSRELTGLIALFASGTALYAVSPHFAQQFSEFMRDSLRADLFARESLDASPTLGAYLVRALRLIALIGLPVAVAGLVLGVAGSFAQIGSVFSSEPLTPDFSKINPIKGLARYFSLRFVLDGLRLVLRGGAVGIVAYVLLKAKVFESPALILHDPSVLTGAFGEVGRGIFIALGLVLLVFAGFDFWLQRWEFGKSVRLTKQEQKEEHKEHEGDPLIKARIKSVQRDLARKRMMEAVRTADVVVTNPTHIAVAIVYQKEKMNAPRVVAKGADFIAQRIKKIAAEAGVPTVENVPLARTLFKTVKVNQFIPRALYQAVAEVLAYVYRLKNKRN